MLCHGFLTSGLDRINIGLNLMCGWLEASKRRCKWRD